MLFKSGKQIHGCIRAKRHKAASENLLLACVRRRGLFRFFPGLTIFITSRPIRTTNGAKVTSRITIPVYFAPFASVTFVARLTGLTSANSKHLPGNVFQTANLWYTQLMWLYTRNVVLGLGPWLSLRTKSGVLGPGLGLEAWVLVNIPAALREKPPNIYKHFILPETIVIDIYIFAADRMGLCFLLFTVLFTPLSLKVEPSECKTAGTKTEFGMK